MISEFNNLSLIDQTNLLKNSVLQIILLRSAATYHIESNTLFRLDENYPENYPELGVCHKLFIMWKFVYNLCIYLHKLNKLLFCDISSWTK